MYSPLRSYWQNSSVFTERLCSNTVTQYLGDHDEVIDETIEMAAQYIKLSNGFVSPGIANALATFQLE